MGLLHTSRRLRILLALLAVTLLGMAGLMLARLPLAASRPPSLPERVEWHIDPHSGTASLLLHGLDNTPTAGVLLPIHGNAPSLPGLPGIWQELAATVRETRLPEQRDGFDGLQLFSLDRTGVESKALHALPGYPENIAIRGQKLWLACNQSGLLLLDLADSLQPELSKVWAATWMSHAAFAGNRAFLLNDSGRLEIVEFAPSGQLRLVARLSLHQADVCYLGISIQQDRLLLLKRNLKTSQSYLSSCRVDPEGIPDLQFSDAPLPIPTGGDCWWRNHHLYLSDRMARLIGIDVRTPLQPRIVLDTVLPAQVASVAWADRQPLVHLIDGSVYALSATSTENQVGTVRYLGQSSEGFPAWLVIAAGRLYAFSPQRGIEVFPSLPILPNSPQAAAANAPELPAGVAAPAGSWSGSVLQTVAFPTGIAMLEDGGRVTLVNAANPRQPVAVLETGAMSRWLARHDDRFYVGGGATVAVLRVDELGRLTRTGEIPFLGGDSFDAVVFDDTLCIAAGRQGVVGFSLADPDRPAVNPARHALPLLRQRVEVRALAVHGRQLFAAGGAAGILKLTVERDHGVALVGVRPIAGPVYAIAAAGNVLLAATKTNVDVLVMTPAERADELQSLGTLPIRNVKRLAILDQGRFGVRQAVGGWQFLPLPALLPVQAGEPARISLPVASRPASCRLLLYNRAGVAEWPDVLTAPALPAATRRSG